MVSLNLIEVIDMGKEECKEIENGCPILEDLVERNKILTEFVLLSAKTIREIYKSYCKVDDRYKILIKRLEIESKKFMVK